MDTSPRTNFHVSLICYTGTSQSLLRDTRVDAGARQASCQVTGQLILSMESWVNSSTSRTTVAQLSKSRTQLLYKAALVAR